jgi:ribonuclease HI
MNQTSKSIIVSDSLSCLTALKNYDTENSLVLDILKKYKTLKEKEKNILFCWVPGHAGIESNEKADREAKYALGTIES